ncbi:hypothetical protein ACWIUD_09500 [Helicobacter sp. 23-1044]
MLILCANLVCALIVAVLDVRFLISFEVAWVGAMMIVWSSYRSVMRKISACGDSSLGIGNSSLTRPSREFEKFSLDEPLVLSHSNFSAQPTKLAQDTRIAEDLNDSKNPSLRGSEATEAIQDSANAESNESCKQNAESNENNTKIAESTPESLPKKERFFIGAKISFGLFRLLSYAFLGISVIALINNGAFFAIPFLLGIALSTLTSAIYAVRKLH